MIHPDYFCLTVGVGAEIEYSCCSRASSKIVFLVARQAGEGTPFDIIRTVTAVLIGNIVNGAIRDVSTIKELDYPVWSCGTTPITGKFRMVCIEMNGPITLCNKIVEPGDLMIADDSGICIVPYDRIEEVLEKTKSIVEAEDVMKKLIMDKTSIEELRPLFRKRYK